MDTTADDPSSEPCPVCGGYGTYESRERRHLLEPPGRLIARCSTCHTPVAPS